MGSSSPLPLPLLQIVGKRPMERRETEEGFFGQASILCRERDRPLSQLSLGPLAQYPNPPLAAPAVRHGSNPYMSEQ